jgi:hypothetical protein
MAFATAVLVPFGIFGTFGIEGSAFGFGPFPILAGLPLNRCTQFPHSTAGLVTVARGTVTLQKKQDAILGFLALAIRDSSDRNGYSRGILKLN